MGRRERDRASLAMRMRGWSDERAVEEERLKDLETFRRSLRRRWGMIAAGGGLLVFGALIGDVRARASALGAVIGGAIAVNAGLGWLVRRSWYRWWQIYALALLDVLLVASLVVFFGPGGMVIGFVVAVLPYVFDQGRGVGDVLVLAAAIAYLLAASLHGVVYDNPTRGFLDLPSHAYFETAAFIAVSLGLANISEKLIRRIRATRATVAQAERGDLTVRAAAAQSDELGLLEQSLNRTLAEVANAIAGVNSEVDELGAASAELEQRLRQMHLSSETMAGTATALARGMGEQHHLAEQGRSESTKAAKEAEGLRSRAELMESDAAHLIEVAERGQDSVVRASETLVSIGHEVRSTVATVQELSGRSDRIGEFTHTVAQIARRTHLLALNAAIEAARAEEHGEGFAVVAEQVRVLASEAARSAREIAELIIEIRSGIDAVASAITVGHDQVRDVGAVADDARAALHDIHAGALQGAELIRATAEISRAQVERMAALTEQLSQMAEISSVSSQGADGAVGAMTAQMTAAEELRVTNVQIAELTESLGAAVARFTLPAPERRD